MKKISRRRFLGGGAACMVSAVAAQTFWPFACRPCEAAITGDIGGRVFKEDAPEKLWKWSREGFLYKKLADNKVICEICPHLCLLAPGDRSVCRSKVNMDGKLYSLAYGNPCSVNTDPIEKKPLFHFKPRIKAFSLATTGCNFRCLNCQNWEISQAKPHEVPYTYELFPDEVIKAAQKSRAEAIAYTYSEPVTFFEYMIDTARLTRHRKMAMLEGIRYVYMGNVARHKGNNTYCHNCKNLLIERRGYFIPTYNLIGNKCKFCNTVIPGVWDVKNAASGLSEL